MSRIRIKDIAKLAQVSTGTVDRVIHNRPGVSEETRIRIQKIIEETDYQPDIIAGTLASGREFRFLVCMPSVVNAHAFWRFPETGLRRALGELQHFDIKLDFVRFDQNNPKDFVKQVNVIDPEAYEGLLFAPVFRKEAAGFMRKWKDLGKPVVLFNARVDGETAESFIGQDAFQSGYLGGKLMSFGLPVEKDLLVVNLSLRTNNYDHIIRRENGFRSYFEEHPDRINNLITLDIPGGQYQDVSAAVEEKMGMLNVAGIFVTNSRVHLVARYLAERGSMNIRLIGYDLLTENINYLKREYIDFLISQSPEEQAYMGLRQLFNVVGLRRPVPTEMLMPIDILTKENIDHYLKFNLQYE